MATFGNPPLAQVFTPEILAELRNIRDAGKNSKNEMVAYLDRLIGMPPDRRNARLTTFFKDSTLTQSIANFVKAESKESNDIDRPITRKLGVLALEQRTSRENIESILIAFNNQQAPLPKDVVEEYKRQLASKPIEYRAEAERLPGYIKGIITLSEFRTALQGIGIIERQ